MASIFRDPYGDDSSEDTSVEEVSYDAEPVRADTQDGVPSSEHSLQVPMAGALSRWGGSVLPNAEAGQHSILFYLSLIEGRCRTQAANSLNKDKSLSEQLPESDPEVLELGRHLFSETCKELHRAGYLPNEYAGSDLENLRTQYLATFDTILHNIASRRAAQPQYADRSVNGSSLLSIDTGSSLFAFPGAIAQRNLQMAGFSSPARDLPFLFMSNDNRTRQYADTFTEIKLLGEGGFGSVFEALHLADGQRYAVKKIHIPASQVSKSSKPGTSAWDQPVLELRSLASLNHPNVVRYHHGWFEKVPPQMAKLGAGGSDDSSSSVSVRKMESLSMKSKPDEYTDPFERTAVSAGSKNNPLADSTHPPSSRPSPESVAIERFPRFSPKLPQESTAEAMLYIQMDLHPMTLNDYIWGEKETTSRARHCFHIPICIQILLAIVSGASYIHRKNIVHRDLKPSNIFLDIEQGPPPPDSGGYINITGCSQCGNYGFKSETYIIPKIGDFGLAAEIKSKPVGKSGDEEPIVEPMALAIITSQREGTQYGSGSKSSQQHSSKRGSPLQQPGTKYYCPPYGPTICPKWDVYSLGVIALELVMQFGTGTERHTVLGGLEKGIFPAALEQHEMGDGIKAMLCHKRKDRWTIEQVQIWLRDLLSKH